MYMNIPPPSKIVFRLPPLCRSVSKNITNRKLPYALQTCVPRLNSAPREARRKEKKKKEEERGGEEEGGGEKDGTSLRAIYPIDPTIEPL